VVARMETSFCNGPEKDIRIYEQGPGWGGYFRGEFIVYVSVDGTTWDRVATTRTDSGKPYASIDLGDRSGVYSFIKVEGISGGGLGSDAILLIAIEAMYPCENE
ncbi:hypothetical protein ACFLTM_05845, partial [Candidatus Bipolaricaulota bacterium]